jgi:SAM-dependent methyltransferase
MGNYEPIKNRFENFYSNSSYWYDEYYGEWMKNSTNGLLNQITIPENPTCLDLGCGTGISTFELVKACNNRGRFYGIDISQKMIDLATKANIKNGYDVNFMTSDAEDIPLPDSMFDLVLCNMSFTYFSDKMKALSELYRVLKSGGQYAFTYNGGASYLEGIKLAEDLALDYPDIPGFSEAVKDTKNMLIDLDESAELFEKAGLEITAIYGRRDMNYSSPSIVVSDKNVFWSTWNQSIPILCRDNIKAKLIAAAKNASSEKGFAHTSYEIFLWGVKT